MMTVKRTLLVAALALASALSGVWAQGSYTDNLIIVLDASGSMDGRMPDGTRKMEAAKQALKEVLAASPSDLNIGLLVFPHGEWVYPLGPRDDEKLVPAIESIRAGGGTPLGENIKKGADRLLAHRQVQYGYGRYRLLVVTDGEAGDARLVEQYTPEVMARGITVDVIGVAMDTDHTLATKVHSYRRADDPQQLMQAIREIVAEVTPATDVAGSDSFAELAGIPDEVASVMIEALSSSGNHPIGEEAKVAEPSGQGGVAGRSAQSPPAGGTSGGSADNTAGTFLIVLICIVGGVVVIGLLISFLTRRY